MPYTESYSQTLALEVAANAKAVGFDTDLIRVTGRMIDSEIHTSKGGYHTVQMTESFDETPELDYILTENFEHLTCGQCDYFSDVRSTQRKAPEEVLALVLSPLIEARSWIKKVQAKAVTIEELPELYSSYNHFRGITGPFWRQLHPVVRSWQEQVHAEVAAVEERFLEVLKADDYRAFKSYLAPMLFKQPHANELYPEESLVITEAFNSLRQRYIEDQRTALAVCYVYFDDGEGREAQWYEQAIESLFLVGDSFILEGSLSLLYAYQDSTQVQLVVLDKPLPEAEREMIVTLHQLDDLNEDEPPPHSDLEELLKIVRAI